MCVCENVKVCQGQVDVFVLHNVLSLHMEDGMQGCQLPGPKCQSGRLPQVTCQSYLYHIVINKQDILPLASADRAIMKHVRGLVTIIL